MAATLGTIASNIIYGDWLPQSTGREGLFSRRNQNHNPLEGALLGLSMV